MGTFAVTLERFNQWDWSRDMREQDNWQAHAAFMDELTAEGFIVLGGPVGDGRRVLMIIEAADEASIEGASPPIRGSARTCGSSESNRGRSCCAVPRRVNAPAPVRLRERRLPGSRVDL